MSLYEECNSLLKKIYIDTTREMKEMQNEIWIKRTNQERAKFMFGMFATRRKMLINSLPKDLSP